LIEIKAIYGCGIVVTLARRAVGAPQNRSKNDPGLRNRTG